jgi:colanic acid/amylovoran biosynthesis protein
MKKFYLTGHHTFSNRGCEAIVRSTVELLREQFSDIDVLVPSSNIAKDRAQWPGADSVGVEFVPAYSPFIKRYWVHLQQFPIPVLKRAGWPFPLPRWIRKTLKSVDYVLSVGGDNYSLDYLFPSLLMGLDRYAMDLRKPVVLWGASVGPFEREPDFLPVIHRHLERMAFIAARESITVKYLTKLGLANKTVHVADPAFVLTPEHIDVAPFWPEDSGKGVVGLNISPLLLRYRPRNEPQDKLLDEVAGFIRNAVVKRGLGVLLVPHVIPHDRAAKNNDATFMAQLLPRLNDLGNHVQLMNDQLNAAETKYVISKCRFFIGARTHSTIAAFSSGVPTVSIAYSVKAIGINSDIFGDNQYVVNASDISQRLLTEQLAKLLDREDDLRAVIRDKMTDTVRQAKLASRKLTEMAG